MCAVCPALAGRGKDGILLNRNDVDLGRCLRASNSFVWKKGSETTGLAFVLHEFHTASDHAWLGKRRINQSIGTCSV